MTVAIVTDSTASLPRPDVERAGVLIVPLHVIVDGHDHVEGRDDEGLQDGVISPGEVARALRSRGAVSTSRPSPAAFLDAYEEAAHRGAPEIISVHLSAELSGTYAAAMTAAQDAPVPVHVVDSGTIGLVVGQAVLAAAADVAAGRSSEQVLKRVERACGASSVRLYVDTLEHLRRGGRIGGAQALLSSALAIKPILEVRDGRIEPLEKVRTRSKALARLQELVAASCRELPEWASGVDVTVQHVDARDRAEDVAAGLAELVPEPVRIVELSAVIGAHVGPGTVGVGVLPRAD